MQRCGYPWPPAFVCTPTGASICVPQVPLSGRQPAGEPVADPVRRPHEPQVCRDLSLLVRTRSHAHTHVSARPHRNPRTTTHARKCRGSLLDVPVCFPQTPLSVRQVLDVTVCFLQTPLSVLSLSLPHPLKPDAYTRARTLAPRTRACAWRGSDMRLRLGSCAHAALLTRGHRLTCMRARALFALCVFPTGPFL